MFDTADAETQRFADNPNGGDEKLAVRFLMLELPNEEKTKLAGYPVFDDVEGISIKVPGGRDEVVRKALPSDKRRFAKHYEAFKRGVSEGGVGLPLKEWPGCNKNDVIAFNAVGIRTVEELAGISDTNIHVLGNAGARLRQRAREYLERAKSEAPTLQLHAALEERDSQIQVLMRAVETLQAQMGIAVQPAVEAPTDRPHPKRKTQRDEGT